MINRFKWQFVRLSFIFASIFILGMSLETFALDTISKKAMGGLFPEYPEVEYGEGPEAEAIKRGEYLVRIGNCIACHTDAQEGIPSFAGGPAIQTPFGKFYGTNITPDKKTGLGKWTEDDFIRAMKEGVSPQGKHYFPVFPYPYFNKLSNQDLRDIWAYLKVIPAETYENKPTTAVFPFSWRFLQLGWKVLYFYQYDGEIKYDPELSEEWNRGRYLVEGLGHCSMCHTPFDYFGGPKRKYHLTGNFIDGYWAPNITAQGLSRSSVDEVVQVFTKGRLSLDAGVVAGPMAEVNHNSLSKLTPDDQRAIAIYLKSVDSMQPIELGQSVKPTLARGKEVYENACAICHRHGQASAPIIGDSGYWGLRAEQGLAVLYRHTINGYNNMPTKGACVTCSDEEVKAAVDYLLYKSLTRVQLKRLHAPQAEAVRPALSGEHVYQEYCSVCHEKGRLGAPKTGDKEVWRRILTKNMDEIIDSVVKGTYEQPVKGGCKHCSTSEIIAAVKHMVHESTDEGDYSRW